MMMMNDDDDSGAADHWKLMEDSFHSSLSD